MSTIYDDGFLYDALFGHDEGIEFYLALAAQYPGPILELCAGTGRIAIPLAKHGFSVTAVDLSRSMLERGQERATEEGVTVAWVEGDIRSYRPPIPQSLIFIAHNSFLHLHTRDDIERALGCIRESLAEGGCFAFDVFNPDLSRYSRDPDRWSPVETIVHPRTGSRLRVELQGRYDRVLQINTGTYRFLDEGDQEVFRHELRLRALFPAELEALLHYNGFAIESRVGHFDGRAFTTNTGRQVVTCKVR
jgi:SAM-dependent methyltransferase